jgi:hypothetical protein
MMPYNQPLGAVVAQVDLQQRILAILAEGPQDRDGICWALGFAVVEAKSRTAPHKKHFAKRSTVYDSLVRLMAAGQVVALKYYNGGRGRPGVFFALAEAAK